MIQSRRSLLGGMLGLIAAPAIVRASSLMPVKSKLVMMPINLGKPRFYITITGINELGEQVREVKEITNLMGDGIVVLDRPLRVMENAVVSWDVSIPPYEDKMRVLHGSMKV